MNDNERLRRAYERWMLIFPRWYRRERGLEMVTALLDDAPPGRRRPSLGEVADLVKAGVRARLGLPRGLLARLAIIMITLYAALAGAAIAVSLTGFPGPPSETQAIAAAMEAIPIEPRNIAGPPVRCGNFCDTPNHPGDDVIAYDSQVFDHSDYTDVSYAIPWDEAPLVIARARERLIAAGWDVTALHTQADGISQFDAVKDEREISVTALVKTPESVDASGSVFVNLSKGYSASVMGALITGAAGGIALGWIVGVWAAQRYRRHPLPRRSRTIMAAGPFLVVAPLTLYGAFMYVVASANLGNTAAHVLVMPQVAIPGQWWQVTVVVAVSVVTTLCLIAWPSRANATTVGAQPDLGPLPNPTVG